ncbi:universal stress protein [Salinibaculum rarum]|uniref:universal stress protein n=1 Tax=Salinibaculum rarum TaxID=3058903 RepID=UPI00265DDA53|nr:universal stress protein [Salinibaculum sp. KK48]
MTIDSILVPTDGSAAADRATEHTLSLAATFDADVHALSVVDLQQAAGPFSAGGLDATFVERLREQANEDVELIADQWAQPERFHGTVEEGRPSTTILEYIDEHDIDIVAMGTHGRSGLRRFVLGSVTEHVLRESPVPVLATHATDEPPALPYQNVLVPTDGSDCATAAVEYALSVAAESGATLHALNVVDESIVVGSPGATLPSNYLDSIETMGEEAIGELADKARDRAVAVETAVERGKPAAGIEAYTDDVDIDLVVMGTHGRSGVERFLLGSTTEEVIRTGTCPVLAVPDGTAE